MAEISVGRLLPNLNVVIESDDEEGELSEEKQCDSSDDTNNSPVNTNVEIVRSWMETLQSPKIYKNKSGGFTTGLDLLSEENTGRLDKRAERFGLEKEECSLMPSITSLYESMGITVESRNSGKMNVRLDALHMRGIDELNTNEVFQYFKEYGPASVEWINDFSCNVVWLDESSCARALLGVSKPLNSFNVEKAPPSEVQDDKDGAEDKKLSSLELIDDDDDDDNKEKEAMDVENEPETKSPPSKSCASLDVPVPPGHWRVGMSHPKTKTILLRFATKDDKKIPGAEKRSNYYKKYGNPNYGGLKGLISSSRKRKIQIAANRQVIQTQSTFVKPAQLEPDTLKDDLVSSRAPKNKTPRMRMYADDEELRKRKQRPIENFTEERRSVHSRLGSKYTKDELFNLGVRPRDPVRSEERDDYENRWDRKRNFPSAETSHDLRTKLRMIRSDGPEEHTRLDKVKRLSKLESLISKHRSPLCDDNSDDESNSSED